MAAISESTIESALLSYFSDLGYRCVAGESLVASGERAGYADPVVRRRLVAALGALNFHCSPDIHEEGARRLLRTDSPTLVRNNAAFHTMLVEGVPLVRRLPNGGTRGDTLRVVDWEHPDANDWLVANQVTVQEGQHVRRADVVVFLNGLPVAVLELKNPADADADIWKAFAQLQTYKAEVPSLFLANGVLAISDGLQARLGTLTADRERFAVWRTVDGGDVAPPTALQLETLVRGVFDKRRFLDLLRHFVGGVGAEELPPLPRHPRRHRARRNPRRLGVGEVAEVCGDELADAPSARDRLDRIEYVEISKVMRGEIGHVAVYERGEEPSRARRRLRHGDTVLSTVRPDRGAYFLCLHPSPSLVASTGFAVLTPKVPWSLVHAAATQRDVYETLGFLADGGAYPAVSPEVVAALPVCVLEKGSKLLDAFHAVAGPMFEKANANRAENRQLAETRDELLPRLLSGEL